ncbi:molybdopterin molybdotransferase MoeA [soil metagenome]
MRSADWLTIEQALAVILEHIEPLGTEHVALTDAVGRTLAEPIVSPIDQPHWDNSAMDGYAVHGSDVRGASAEHPIVLRVIDDVKAGGFPAHTVGRGEATRIMTGAPVPIGVDGVVRVEHTRALADDRIEVISDADAGRNVRRRGEDLTAGESVFAAGRLLRPAEVGVLAMIGHTQPLVCVRPRVAVLATGDELVEPDRLDAVVAGTHIINSNSPAVAAALELTGCTPMPLGIARDDLADLRERLGHALDADALITTAGASVGEHDLVKDALEEIGCDTLFWRVKIRPGSPFSFGVVRRPDHRLLPVFGLPGNPVSVLVTFEVLVRPALRRMLGRTRVYPATMTVRAGEDIAVPAGLTRFLRVRLERADDGVDDAYLTGPQGSGILTSVAAADALLIMPLDAERIARGELARAVPLHGADLASAELLL